MATHEPAAEAARAENASREPRANTRQTQHARLLTCEALDGLVHCGGVGVVLLQPARNHGLVQHRARPALAQVVRDVRDRVRIQHDLPGDDPTRLCNKCLCVGFSLLDLVSGPEPVMVNHRIS